MDDAITLAVLIARELDAGVAAALISADGVLVLDQVVARVGRADEGPGAWEAEIVLRREDREALGQDSTRSPGLRRLPAEVAALPVEAVEGVGRAWAGRLSEAGLVDVGGLAEAGADVLYALSEATKSQLPLTFAARARGCAVGLDHVPPSLAGLSLWEVLAVPPVRTHQRTGAALVTCVEVWDAASTLSAHLDARVLRLQVRVLGSPAV